MNTGMLWFDNDSKTTLAAKIERAVAYYQKKYGRKPNLCLIHPNAVHGESQKTDKATGPVSNTCGVTVRPYRPVLPGHLWIGVEDKN